MKKIFYSILFSLISIIVLVIGANAVEINTITDLNTSHIE